MGYLVYKKGIRDRNDPFCDGQGRPLPFRDTTYFLIPGKIHNSRVIQKRKPNLGAGHMMIGGTAMQSDTYLKSEELDTTQESFIILGDTGRNSGILGKNFSADSLQSLKKEYRNAWDEVYGEFDEELHRKANFTERVKSGDIESEDYIREMLERNGPPVLHLRTVFGTSCRNEGDELIFTSKLSEKEIRDLYPAIIRPHMDFYQRFVDKTPAFV